MFSLGLTVQQSLGMLETTGFSPALVALDVMEKQAGIQVLQAEVNDFLGICIKILGPVDNVEQAVKAGFEIADQMGGKPVIHVIRRVDEKAWKVINGPREYNPLIEQDVVVIPDGVEDPGLQLKQTNSDDKGTAVADTSYALGLIETQGFTAVFEAIDSACKAANVEVIGKEKLGGGYITVIIRGDVAAVNAAIEAGSQKVEGLGTLIAAHVIARPSPSVLSLLPK
jgi:microcompartment protein CcmL/EutN